MAKITIDEDKCIGCGACVDACASGVLEMRDGKAFVKNEQGCIACKSCANTCPVGAIIIED